MQVFRSCLGLGARLLLISCMLPQSILVHLNSSVSLMNHAGIDLEVLGAYELWVDAENGDDANDGMTPGSAFRTIQRAADQTGPGTTVHILPGIYRETVRPAASGSAAEQIRYVAEEGPGTAIIRGSEPSASLAWTQLATNTIGLPPGVDPTQVYWAELADWTMDSPPRFVVELDGSGHKEQSHT